MNEMILLKKSRNLTKISQRRLAQKSGSSFRTIQLMESGKHNPRLSTLKKLSAAMGYPEKLIERRMDYIWKFPPESAQMIAEFIEEEGESTWKLHLMNFVDRFRMAEEKVNYISEMPTAKISARLSALIASSVETLCEESGIETPSWTLAFPPLKEPWFVAEVESLKALAVIESPVQFRKRNLFVLGNFLDRA